MAETGPPEGAANADAELPSFDAPMPSAIANAAKGLTRILVLQSLFVPQFNDHVTSRHIRRIEVVSATQCRRRGYGETPRVRMVPRWIHRWP